MARVYTESFEAGTAGAAPTGTVFNPIPATGAVIVTTPSSVLAHGTKAVQLTTPATAANRIFPYNLGAATSVLHSADYYYFPALPAAGTFLYLGSKTSAGAARCNWRVNSDGTVSMRNNVTAVYTSTETIPINTLLRFEWRVDATAGQQQLRVYNGHSLTPLFDSGNQTYNMGTFDAHNGGLVIAASNASLYWDWSATDDATWVGPAVIPPPTASFTRTPASGQAPLTVTFTNTSTGATSYLWNYGDGNTSTTTSSSWVYSTPGTYTVTLTATNASGSTSTSQTVTVTGPPPTASFTASATSGTAPFAVTFTNTSTGSPTSYAWNFGDGTTSTATSPSKTYSTAGTYTVTLTATNANGTSAPATTTISVATAGSSAPAGGGLATYVMTATGWQPITIAVWVP